MRFSRLLLIMAALAPSSAFAQSADQRLQALYAAEWEWRLVEFAQPRRPDDPPLDHFEHVDVSTQEAHLVYWRDKLKALDGIPLDQLSEDERVNAQVFHVVLEAFLAQGKYRQWEAPFNSDSQFWSDAASRPNLQTAEDYRNYISRMRDLPRYFDEQIVNMRAGLKRGFTVPKATLNGRDKTIAAFLSPDSTANPYYLHFTHMTSAIPPVEQAALHAEAREVVESHVKPAYSKLLNFYLAEYYPRARTTLAAEALPDGKAFYRAQIKEYTTTDLTAEQIHDIGLKEVARISANMEATKAAAGFKGDMPDFLHFLRTDPQFYAKTPDELLGFASYVTKRMDAELKNILGFLPRYRFTVRPVPDEIAPYYTSGRGGLEACMINTYDLASRPLYQMAALVAHECSPGHSLQAAIALETPERPEFRTQTYFSGNGEGWGLYSEWLASTIGIYKTPYEEFGRESMEMWRAVRLVVDTGIHHSGWSRQQAIGYLASHTALARADVESEVDRYISWPGQALAYKLGEMTIRRMRAKAEAQLGPAFNQRWFHDRILALGSVPLPVLEDDLNRWIAGGGKNPRGGN